MADDPVGGEPGAPDVTPESLHHRLADLERRADRLEKDAAQRLAPAWRRVTRGEHRWPSTVVVLGVVALQVALPERLSMGHRWVWPTAEIILLVVLTAGDPRRIERSSAPLRILGLLLIAVVSLANGWSVVHLVTGLVNGTGTDDAATLLASGGNIWLTNVAVFGVWYWELDRGGPAARRCGSRPYPDLLFPQMSSPGVAPRDWEPRFVDYLYVSFTNATAFSPTDTLPLSRWAKFAMLLQSAISLVTAALVIARAVNVLR